MKVFGNLFFLLFSTLLYSQDTIRCEIYKNDTLVEQRIYVLDKEKEGKVYKLIETIEIIANEPKK